jgi:hypothetical protein
MPIQTSCPSCFRPLRVPDELIGQAVRCPGCATEWIAKPPDAPAPVESRQETPPPATDQPPTEAYRGTPPAGATSEPVSEGIRQAPGESVPVPPTPPAPPERDEFDDEDEDDVDDDRYFERLEERRRERLRRNYTGQAKSKVMGPAIGLMVTACITLFAALFQTVTGVINAVMMSSVPPPPPGGMGGPPPRGVFALTSGIYGLQALFYLVLGGVTLYGAIQMMRLRRYPMALTSCILGIIPCHGCCYITGIPFGIWGLVVLLDPKVKAVFGRGGRPANQPLPPIADAGE